MGISLVQYRICIGTFKNQTHNKKHNCGTIIISSCELPNLRLKGGKRWLTKLLILSLLALSGDVESNPGPKPTQAKNTSDDDPTSNSMILNEIRLLAESQNKMERNFNQKINRLDTKFDEILSSNNDLKKDVEQLKNACGHLSEEMERLDKRFEELSLPGVDSPKFPKEGINLGASEVMTRLIDLENRARRNNIIISNITEENRESWEEAMEKARNFFSAHLEMENVVIERAHRLGPKAEGKIRPMIVKLLNYADKNRIWRNIHKLKGTNYTIREDFAKETRRIRSELWNYAMSSKLPEEVFKIRFDKLIFRGSVYTYDTQSASIRQISGPPITLTQPKVVQHDEPEVTEGTSFSSPTPSLSKQKN